MKCKYFYSHVIYHLITSLYRFWYTLSADQDLKRLYMVSDKNGHIARSYGVLDTDNHEAFNACFMINSDGLVQARNFE